jgi:hypothetical protein
MTRHLHLWASLLAAGALAGCILLADKDAAKDDKDAPKQAPSPIAGARVAGAWQERAIALLKADAKASDLYGLFTEGGWSDDGQVMVLATGDAAQVVFVKPNSKEKSEAARALTATEWTAFKPQAVAAANLADISVEAFDALTYEYVHWQKTADGIKDVKRVFIRNPSKPMPEHDKLLKAFEALKPR